MSLAPDTEVFPPDGGPIDYADWPPVLRKALHDQWRYAVGLVNGEVIIFGRAEIEGDWITMHDLESCEWLEACLPQEVPFFWGRGLCVHKRQIAWCADCDS